MICLLHNGTITLGPCNVNDLSIRHALYVSGYTEIENHLLDPEGNVLPGLPAEEPLVAIDLGQGFRILPVVEVNEETPSGKIMGDRFPVVVGDVVEMRPTWVDLPPPPSLDEVKAAKQAEIHAAKTAALVGGFMLNGVRWDSDANARIAYLELALELQAQPLFSTPWKASLGVWVTMDAATFSAVKAAGASHVEAVFARQAELDEALGLITVDNGGVPAVQALDINTGWPVS